jgi:Flp pilus assembly protein TadG
VIHQLIARLAADRRSESGQALVLVALMFLVLLGFVGFAVDVSSAYSTRRFERSVADSAALAGAQDLQSSLSQSVSAQQRKDARTHALVSLKNQLKATGTQITGTLGSNCDPQAGDILDCELTPPQYHVSITTPAKTCLAANACDSDAQHSVQVVIHKSVETAFARLFGQRTWDVGITSVAGVALSAKYAVITLQPPDIKKNFSDANLCNDLVVDGNRTVLKIKVGDIGTNTSAATTNQGLIQLNDGDYTNNPYKIYHIDDLTNASCGLNSNPTWSVDANGNPPGKQIIPATLIQDPGYYQASFAGVAPFKQQSDGAINCSDTSVDFPTDAATIALLTPAAGGTRTCYQKGIYEQPFTVANKDVAYLMPGAYSFERGVTVNSTLAGGMVNIHAGVVLVFPENQNDSFLANNSNSVIMLNAGSASCASDSCRATPAVDFAGTPVKTPAGLVITVEVLPRDNNCFSGNDPIISNSCQLNQNKVIKLTAAQLVLIAGVLYGPSDNMNITGGSSQKGLIGQVVSWTVKYAGQSTLNQSYPGAIGLGILRLDRACSGPLTPCSP